MPDARDGTLRRDILSAYAASISRVLSWVVVSALVYRKSPEAFAMLALVRGTLGILNYAALGLLPAMIQQLARGPAEAIPAARVDLDASQEVLTDGQPIPLAYRRPRTSELDTAINRADPAAYVREVVATGNAIACVTAVAGVLAACVAAFFVDRLYHYSIDTGRGHARIFVATLGAGLAIRWLGDPSGALLQARRRIFLDNLILVGGEIMWVALVIELMSAPTMNPAGTSLAGVGTAYFAVGLLLVAARCFAAGAISGQMIWRGLSSTMLGPLLATGALITVAQLADYLYAPTDLILINRLLTTTDLAHYAPTLQIDAGLMLLVTALGTVLLPKTALAHAAGDHEMIRRYYLRGTLASAAMLLLASLVIYAIAPWLFRIWFGNPMPGAVAILPLVLLNTIIGGSSAVGRAILIGIGRTKPFAVSVLLAGVTNVLCSYVFVRYLGWGLRGIVLGTVVAVVGRCGIWMPWYVMRKLKCDA